VNGKAVGFTVTSETDIADLAVRTERYLDKHEIPSRDRLDAKLIFRPASLTANAYRSAISTEIKLIRGGSGWYLTGAKRAPLYPRAGDHFLITMTERALCNVIAFGGYTLPPAT